MADFFGHSNDLITLSQVLTYNTYTLLTCAGTRVKIYGFLCINARKADVLFIPYETNK
jgi:hypothetical protein